MISGFVPIALGSLPRLLVACVFNPGTGSLSLFVKLIIIRFYIGTYIEVLLVVDMVIVLLSYEIG